jgi:hypothetical protein
MGKDKEIEQEIESEIVENTTSELEAVIPSMNVGLPAQQQEEKENIISDEALLGIYGEILTNLREDREELSGLLSNFVEMVINEGDSTTSSKEALVNLVKIKQETADKMAKIADLMTRVKLKEKDTFPRYLAAKQENNLYLGDNTTKRELLKQIERHQKAVKKKEQ